VAKAPKAEKGAYIEVYFGINPRTKKVDRVFRTNDGKLEGKADTGAPRFVLIGPGRLALDEVRIAFELTDLFVMPILLVDSERTKERVAELEAKATAG
jgi:hypothetical protein